MQKSHVIEHFGSQAAVGRFLRVGRAAVQKWPDIVPESWAAILHVRTRGKLRYDPQEYTATPSSPESSSSSPSA